MSVITVGKACDLYVRARWDRGEISKETRRSFIETLRLFAEFVGRASRMGDVRRQDVERWLGDMKAHRQDGREGGVASATIRVRLSTLKGFCQWAVVEGYARVDPTLGIRGPKKPKSVVRSLNSEDEEKVMIGALDARELLILTLMREEGLRAGGVARLELGDIDLVEEIIYVTEKGDNSRPLPLTEGTREVLEAYLAERGRQAGPLLQSYQRSYAATDEGLSARTVSRLASLAIKRAGIDESGHVLRHTMAHAMLDNGADLRDVQTALGHASLGTVGIYTGRADVRRLRNFMGRHGQETGADDG